MVLPARSYYPEGYVFCFLLPGPDILGQPRNHSGVFSGIVQIRGFVRVVAHVEQLALVFFTDHPESP